MTPALRVRVCRSGGSTGVHRELQASAGSPLILSFRAGGPERPRREESAVRFSPCGAALYLRVRFLPYLLVVLYLSLAPPASGTISYTISLAHPDDHLFNVTMTVPTTTQDLVVAIPAWNALYQIRDFADRMRDVTAVCASSDAAPLHLRALDKQTWRILSDAPCRGADRSAFVIHYLISWDEPGPFDSELNAHHAFMNLAEILMYVPDRRVEDVSLQLTDIPPGWRVGTALAGPRASDAPSNNAFVASGYDVLVDAPIEVGSFENLTFEVARTQIHVIVDDKHGGKGHLEDSLRQITAYEMQLMHDAPFDAPNHDYTFLFHIGALNNVGGGGMEHRNSSAIACVSPEECIQIAAHEFFHSWNVKRIRPQSLDPVDYSREQYSRALWFAEGVTSTYAAFTLERTGLWSKEAFYQDLATQVSRLQSRPARLWQSAEESSLDAWLEGSPEYNTPERSISYYNKGQILGELLDLAIRDSTDNRKSLDDVMRRMNDEYAKAGKFYDDSNGICSVVEEVSGKSFQDFFERYVAGTREIPYNDFLSAAGLILNNLPSEPNAPRFSISEAPHPTDRQRRIRDGFLHGTTD